MTVATQITSYIQQLKKCLDDLDKRAIDRVINVLTKTYTNNKTVFILGNGGSASNASHMACDLGKGTLKRVNDDTEPRFRVISLTDNVAIMTAFANDLSYEDVFVQQLRNLVTPGDVLVVLSASGNSKNVIKAVAYAKKNGATTIGFLGFKTGGRVASLVDHAIIVRSNQYSHCEDVHLVLNHIVTAYIAQMKHAHDTKNVLHS